MVEVVDKPDCFVSADDIADKYPDVFAANVVYRVQKSRIGSDFSLNDSFMLPMINSITLCKIQSCRRYLLRANG